MYAPTAPNMTIARTIIRISPLKKFSNLLMSELMIDIIAPVWWSLKNPIERRCMWS